MKVVKIYNITDKEYEAYGRVLTKDYQVDALVKEMEKTPAPDHVIYIASDAGLEALDQAKVTSFNYHILFIFNSSFCHFPDYRPQIVCQFLVIVRCQIGIMTSDQSHFEMILTKVRDFVFFHEFLRQSRLAGMSCTGNKKYHTIHLLLNLYNSVFIILSFVNVYI